MDRQKILIVEDDLDLSEMLNTYFRVQNYDVLTAAWGKEAIEIGQHNDLALVMLDIRLPDIDGYEVCRQLRSQRNTQSVPIIFLTEKRDRVDKLQGLELGVVDYVTKPFDIQELRLRVRNAISRAVRQTSTNPVTELPEQNLVDEKLAEVLTSQKNWCALVVKIVGLSDFRQEYGFVAADDVLRAVTLMIRNAVREHGNEDDFIGHLDAEDFAVVTTPDKTAAIRERIEARMNQSREYFYPLKDRDKARDAAQTDSLQLRSRTVESSTGPYESVDALKKALTDASEAKT